MLYHIPNRKADIHGVPKLNKETAQAHRDLTRFGVHMYRCYKQEYYNPI